MQIRKNPFKQALKEGRKQLGIWSGLRSNTVAEMLAVAGYDWIVVDTEHGPNEVPDVLLQLQVIQPLGSEPMVRLAWNDPVLMKRILDIGAQTLLIPMVQNAEEARAAVAATRYPPDGIRGVMSLARMNGFGKVIDYYQRAAEEICVVVQAETITAVENIPGMAAIDGVDGIFIGPSDLSASMGHIGNPNHPEVQKEIRRGLDLCHKHSKPAGILTASVPDAERYIEWGYDFIAVGSDLGMMAGVASQRHDHFRAKLGSK